MPPTTDVLFVCTANLIRSPLAAALLQREQRARGGEREISVGSAGVRARSGQQPDPLAVEVASAAELSIAGHRSTPVTAPSLLSGLVLTMEERHRDALIRRSPASLAHTFTLLEFLRLAAGRVGRDDGLRGAALLAHRARAQTPGAPGPEDVSDPIGGPRADYEATLRLLTDRISALAELVLGRRTAPPAH